MPYWQAVLKSDPSLDDDQSMIVYLDCYPVHSGEEFQFVWQISFYNLVFCSCKLYVNLNFHQISEV